MINSYRHTINRNNGLTIWLVVLVESVFVSIKLFVCVYVGVSGGEIENVTNLIRILLYIKQFYNVYFIFCLPVYQGVVEV